MKAPETAHEADVPGLADALKAHTWDWHVEAERTGVISDILNRRSSKETYTLFVRNLLPIYAALDTTFPQMHAFEGFEHFLTPALQRAEALASDLQSLAGPRAQQDLPVLEETQAYCAHIQHASAHSPAALIGHIYVRYLGDLYGGQTMGRLLGKSLGLDGTALRFYTFSGITNLVDFRNGFRAVINGCDLDAKQRSDALDAAQTAFECNVLVSKKLQSVSPQVV